MTTVSRTEEKRNMFERFLRSSKRVVASAMLATMAISSVSCSSSAANDNPTRGAPQEMAAQQNKQPASDPATTQDRKALSRQDPDETSPADRGKNGGDTKKESEQPDADKEELGTLTAAGQQDETEPRSEASEGRNQYGQGTDNSAQPQQGSQQPLQQTTDPVEQQPISMQPLYVQESVVGGFGTLWPGYGIGACPLWRYPTNWYAYDICYNYDFYGGYYRPYLWYRYGNGWRRNYYGAGEFGRFFGNNNSGYGGNNYGRSAAANNTTRGQQQQRGQRSTSRQTSGTQGRGNWSSFNGQRGSPQNRAAQAPAQRSNNNSRAYGVQRQNTANRSYNDMLRRQAAGQLRNPSFNQRFNFQQHQMQHQAPAMQHSQPAPAFHAAPHMSAPHYSGGGGHSGGGVAHGGGGGGHSSGRRR